MMTITRILSVMFQIGLDAAVKSVILLGLAMMITGIGRNWSAAARHRIWSLALLSCLILPAVSFLLPQLRLPVLPQRVSQQANEVIRATSVPTRISSEQELSTDNMTALATAPIRDMQNVAPPAPAFRVPSQAPVPAATVSPHRTTARTNVPWLMLTFCGIWSSGVLVTWLALAAAIADIHRSLIRSMPGPDDWQLSVAKIANQLRISKSVGVRCDQQTTVPIVGGIIYPVIFMPSDAETWSQERCDYALMHELVHVERRDVLWQFFGQLAAGLYWFNPLAWLAVRRLRCEREWACDDRVVQITGRASDYATQLIGIARSARAPTPMNPAVAMAQTSDLEKRLIVMFDRARSHLPLNRRSALRLAMAFTVLLVLVATVKPVARVLRSEARAQSENELTDAESDKTEMRVNVVDEAGQPIANANIHVSIWEPDSKPQQFPNRNFTTDADGSVTFTRPKEVRILRLWASHQDFVTLFANFEEGTHGDGSRLPMKFNFTLPRGIEIGGRVVDEDGHPVDGARIEATLNDNARVKSNEPNTRFDMWLATEEKTVTSDSDGRWVVKNVPTPFDRDGRNRVALKFNHVDFISLDEQGFSPEPLRSLTHETILKRGIHPEGYVRDPNGNAVAGALVIRGDDPYLEWGSQEVITNDQGFYQFPAQAPGKFLTTVVAKSWMPQMREIDLTSDSSKSDFQLERGRKLTLKIVDGNGKPVSRCYVSVREWRGKKSLYNHDHPDLIDSQIPRRANEQGMYVWDWAPADAVKFQIYIQTYNPREMELVASDEVQTIVLQPQAKVFGSVTDGNTGKPVPQFTVCPTLMFDKNNYAQDINVTLTGRRGKYETMLYRADVPYMLLVEAEGYRLATGQPFLVTDGDHQEDFRLEPAPVIKGRILDSQGRLLKGAKVHLATMVTPVQYNNDDDFIARAPFVTGESGYFQFAAPSGPYKLVVVHPDGYRRLDFEQDQQPGQIRLEPWARIEGSLWQAGQPVPNATILLQLPNAKAADRVVLRESRQVRTDANGRFVFPLVPPARVVIRPYLSVWTESPLTSSHHLAMDAKPGERIELNLGQGGARIVGRVVLKGDVPEKFDLNYSLNYLIRRNSALSAPNELEDVAEQVKHGWTESVLRSSEGTRYLDLHDQHFVRLTSDGAFLISGVTPGEYDFAISIYERPQGCLIDPIAVKIVPVSINQTDVDQGGVSLPDIEIQFPERLHVGGTLPDLALNVPSGKPIKLSQFHGRPLLIHGWATWCPACIEFLPKLKQLRADVSTQKLAILGINLDEDLSAANEFARSNVLEWDHVFVGLKSEIARRLGFSSIPSYIVVSSEGKIVLQTNEFKDAAEEIRNILEN